MACDLCDLPTPDPPVTGEDGQGTFCCRGCREVADRLEDFDPGGAASDPTGTGQNSDTSTTGQLRQESAPESRLDTGDPDATGEEVFFAVEGMHCATCELFLEASATDHPAVADASASYPTGSIRLVYDDGAVAPAELTDLLDGTGYTARPIDEDAPEADGPVPRLLVGGFFGMMTMLWYLLFLYPAYLGLPADVLLLDVHGRAGTYLLANTWVMATVILGYTGYPIFRGAYVSLRAGQPNMDLLVALAAGTAYTYSAVAVILGHVEVYFDIAVVVILVVTLGEYYKRRVTDRAAGALADLTRERADRARRRSEDGAESVGVDDLAPGDEVVVRAGERIPLDGTVLEGHGAVDASLVTGESVPERRSPGDEVVGGAEVCDGALVVSVASADESTLDRVVRRLWTIQTSSSGVQRLADRIALVFVPLVVALAIGAGLVHWGFGAGPVAALLTALTVLIVSCPCALGLATPLSVASATRAGLDRGVAVLDETVFERATDVDVVALDKTGTLTTGEMRVASVLTADVAAGAGSSDDLATDGGRPRDEGAIDGGVSQGDGQTPGEGPADDAPTGAVADGTSDSLRGGDPVEDGTAAAELELLSRAAALEQFADHPVAAAVVDAAGAVDRTVTDLSVRPGLGVTGAVDDVHTAVGHPDLLREAGFDVFPDLERRVTAARERGDVPALVGWEGRARGVIVAADQPRVEWEGVLETLQADHDVVLLTGDEPGAAAPYREHDAVDEVFAGVPPEGKAALVEELRTRGSVAMVGDGTNDAPALAAADVGISLSSGTALAAEAADVVVTSPDLDRVADVFDLTRAARTRVRQNLGWAFAYNAVAVPLAVLGALNPLLAAVAMTASSLLVVGNSTRSFLRD